MRDLDDPELLSYLTDENLYANAWFGDHDATIETLFEEIRSRVQETDMSVPVRSGPWWYVSSTVEGSSYPIHHRGPTRDDATAQTLLDENVEALGHEYFDVGAFDMSHDHTLAAWSFDTQGDERYTLHVRDLGTGVDLPDEIQDVANAGVAWSRDGSFLFYVTADDQERPYRVRRHALSSSHSSPSGGATDDVLVYEETDERYFVGVGETRSDDFVIIQSSSKTSSEIRLISADEPTEAPILVRPRAEDVEYNVDHWGDVLIMHTNDSAIDFRIMAAPIASDWTDPASWTELVAHVAGRRIMGADPFEGHLVISEWADAQPRLRILFRDGSERIIDLGDEPHDVDLSSNPEWTTTEVRFGTQSTTVPPTLYEEQVATGERTLLRRVPTPNVDLDQYRSARLWAQAPDGMLVPVDIVHHVDTPLDGTAPGVVYGYGAYEASMPPWFSVARAVAARSRLRVGARAPAWRRRTGSPVVPRRQARSRRPTRSPTPSPAPSTSSRPGSSPPDRLCIRGGSAGGLLVGACITMRPDLFASAVAEVPFVDIVSTMSDPTLPLTVTEWEEWGDPASRTVRQR